MEEEEDPSNSNKPLPCFPNSIGIVIPKLEPLDSNPIQILPKTLTLTPHFLPHVPPLSPNPPLEALQISRFLSLFPSPKKRPRGRTTDLHRITAISAAEESLSRSRFRRTRLLYESLRTHLIQQERPALPAGKRSRADLVAASLMHDRNLWLHRDMRIVGYLPGIHIGDVFFYRMELLVLGIHGQVQAGIDFLTAERSPNGDPIATSIVVSGGYEDDVDTGGDVIVYTGHGGRKGKNAVKHSLDQKLETGNLALERSHFHGIEIRVVRGMDCDNSPTNRVYVYDGLFRVVKWWSERGRSGFRVYKFRLERIKGQVEMGSEVIRRVQGVKMEERMVGVDGYLSLDVSNGKENKAVSVVNCVDGDREPLSTEYLVRPVFVSKVKRVGGGGCLCEGSCGVDCECVMRNGGEMVYDGSGRIVRGKPIVYECGNNCGCPFGCGNRLSQNGLRHRLEIFRSEETQWAVRSLDFIQAGEFVCEFSGLLLKKKEAEKAIAETGVTLVDTNRFPKRWEEWGDLSMVKSDYEKPAFPALCEVGHLIDVSNARNVACYLSHSCQPNLFVQLVEFNQSNGTFPRLMIFAMENIPPMRELSLDYGVGEVQGGESYA